MRLRSIPNASEMLPSFSNYVPEPGIFKERWSSYFGNYNEIHLRSAPQGRVHYYSAQNQDKLHRC